MERLVRKYSDKLVAQGLALHGEPLLGGLDDDLVWTREASERTVLEGVIDRLNINSILHCRPAEPYGSIIEHLAKGSSGTIFPMDTETRTFLHDLPVADRFDVGSVSGQLKRRKSVITPGGWVTTFGTVSPEEAYIVFSSVCFAAYVKFMADCLTSARRGGLSKEVSGLMATALDAFRPVPPEVIDTLREGPIAGEREVHAEMARVGEVVVENELVDSYFGNISYLLGQTLHISQTGSSMDELAGCIDPCPLDGSSSAGITASSELTAHKRIVEKTGALAVLHGHPKFAVTISLDCEVEDCPGVGRCHLECPRGRFMGDIPIVPGEVGTGKWGLCNEVPDAMVGRRGVIVYGHGVFTVGRVDFRDALVSLFEIENQCRDEFERRVG